MLFCKTKRRVAITTILKLLYKSLHMKKRLINSLRPLTAAAAFCVAVISCHAATYEFNADHGVINLPENWLADGSPATALPGAADNAIINNKYVYFDYITYPNFVLEVNNLTLLNDARLAPSEYDESQMNYWVLKAPSLKVNGTLTANGGDVCLGRYKWEQFRNISVGEDFLISNVAKASFIGGAWETYNTDNPSFRVQGSIIFSDSGGVTSHRLVADYSSGNCEAYYKIGGLDSSNAGKTAITNGNEGTGITRIEFAPADSGKYAGTFQGGYFRGFVGIFAQTSPGFEFIMNDTSGSGSRQTLRFDASHKGEHDKTSDIHAVVRSGHLEVYGSKSDGLKSLFIEDGLFGAAGENINTEIGTAEFERITWYSEAKIQISLDFNSLTSDFISADSLALDPATPNDLFEFIFDYIGDFDDSREFAIFSADNLSDEMLEKFTGKTADGLHEAKFAIQNGNLVVSGFNNIPEPAAVAAIMGAFAVFIAARRRKA